jgi:glutaredoxin 3
MAEKQVKVYSTPTCPWCKKVKQFLADNNVQYQDLNVADDKGARDEMIKMTHQMAVPTVSVNGDFVVGYNEKAIKEKLNIK